MAEPTADELLLAAVRNYCDITWADAATDTKTTGLIQRGKAYLDGIAGEAQDYAVEGQARSLLFDYVRYFRSNAGEMFKVNYRDELIALRLAREVADYEDETTDPEL